VDGTSSSALERAVTAGRYETIAAVPPRTRHKCFISYHQADLVAVDRFITRFGRHTFIKRGITLPEEVIGSSDTAYVMQRVRQLYLRDSTVTIILIGSCTWSRRFVDWEIQSSLRRPVNGYPNGLIGILLDPRTRPPLPPRFAANCSSGYAKYHYYPKDVATLESWIEDAYQARVTRRAKISNPRDRYRYNRICG
jgi:hypothetical protein